MRKGTIVMLKKPCLGNPDYALGIVYDCYQDFDDSSKIGVSVIFENGEYCGFSYAEQQDLLDPKGTSPTFMTYQFTNVMQLARDHKAGIFKKEFANFLKRI